MYKAITYVVCTIVVINTIRFGDFFGLFPQQYPQEESQHVVAQTIGKITEHKWVFTIYNAENRMIAGDVIQIGDRVVVNEKGMVKVLIQDSFMAQVQGPAQFEIVFHQENNSYNFKFLNGGDNIAIDSVTPVHKQIAVQTSDGVVITNTDKTSEHISFSLQKNSATAQRSVVNHSATSLAMKQIYQKDKEDVVIQPKHTVDFVKESDQDITILAHQEIIQAIPIVVKATPMKSAQKEEQHPVLNDEQIDQLQLILQKAFLRADYTDLQYYYLIGKDHEYKTMIENIDKRLDRVATVLGVSMQTVTSLEQVAPYAESLIQELIRYENTTLFVHNLRAMINLYKDLSTHQYWVLSQAHTIKPVTKEFIKTIIPSSSDSSYHYF